MMTTGSTSAHSASRVAVSALGLVRLGSTLTLVRPIDQRHASMIARPISMPGTMPAMNSLVIDTPPSRRTGSCRSTAGSPAR